MATDIAIGRRSAARATRELCFSAVSACMACKAWRRAAASGATASAKASKAAYEAALKGQGFGTVTTEIRPAPEFYFAEDYHQQYLAKNPNGYCGLGGTGVSCPIGTGVAAQ